jgi:DNA-binding YbaB/EbfC family protein
MNVMKILKQAQSMQKNVEKVQAELAQRTYEFSAGGGAVKVTAKGDLSVTAIVVAPSVLQAGDAEMLQDLLLSGVNGALKQAQDAVAQEMAKVTGGLNIPGLG